MIDHLDVRVLKVVMDQVDLTIKELSLDAVLAPSPVSVDIGEPVVLVVKRPVGDDQLVVPRHLHLPAAAPLKACPQRLHQLPLRALALLQPLPGRRALGAPPPYQPLPVAPVPPAP